MTAQLSILLTTAHLEHLRAITLRVDPCAGSRDRRRGLDYLARAVTASWPPAELLLDPAAAAGRSDTLVRAAVSPDGKAHLEAVARERVCPASALFRAALLADLRGIAPGAESPGELAPVAPLPGRRAAQARALATAQAARRLRGLTPAEQALLAAVLAAEGNLAEAGRILGRSKQAVAQAVAALAARSKPAAVRAPGGGRPRRAIAAPTA